MKIAKRILYFLLLSLMFVISISGCSLKGEGDFIVKEHLDDVILEINDTKFTFRDIGYYIANGEAAVEAQALIYNPDNPEQYWNKHTNGIFIKVQTRQNVMDNFTRDAILAMEAKNQGITLSDTDKANCKTTADGLFDQLSAYQKEEAGITIEALEEVIQNAYLGQLYINYKLENDGSDYMLEDWQLDGVCYKGLLGSYKVKIIDETWEKAEFGKITINREEE